MTYAGVWVNDGQIDDLRVIRAARVERPGWMDVVIEPMSLLWNIKSEC